MQAMFHHVQLACPAGSEEDLRAYYGGVLGMEEKSKPAFHTHDCVGNRLEFMQ